MLYHNATLVDAKLTQFIMYNAHHLHPPIIENESERISLNAKKHVPRGYDCVQEVDHAGRN